MAVDRKTEEIYLENRERKTRLDKGLKIVSGLMLAIPFVALLLIILGAMPEELSHSLIRRGRAGGKYTSGVGILVSGVFAIGQTIAGSQKLIKFAPAFYLAEFVLAAVLLFTGNLFYSLLFLGVSAASFVLSLIYKKLYSEEQEMQTLEGYPDFNPILVSRINAREVKDPAKMTADERLLYEREHNR